MKNQKINTSINTNTEALKEDAGIFLIPIGIIFILLYIIPFIQYVFVNYIATWLSLGSKYDEKLSKSIQSICNYPIEVYVSDSDMYNAWNIGSRKIFITEKLINKLTEREIIAVLLHEAGHYANNDAKKLIFMVNPIGTLVIIFILFGIYAAMLSAGVFIPYLAPILAVMLGFIKEFIINKTFGRKYEFLADSFASEYGYGNEMYSALKKLEKEFKKDVCKNLSKDVCNLELQSVQFWDEHPSLAERKINIKLKTPKYERKILDHTENNTKLVKLSFLELNSVMKELKIELKKYKESKGKR